MSRSTPIPPRPRLLARERLSGDRHGRGHGLRARVVAHTHTRLPRCHLQQLAEEAYKTEGCAKTPDTDKCKGLQAAVNKATSALEDAEDSAATAFASASALVAVAVGIAAGVVF